MSTNTPGGHVRIFSEVQKISAGSDLDGAAPGGTASESDGTLVWTPATSGGLFVLYPSVRRPLPTLAVTSFVADVGVHRVATRISLSLGGQSAWSISVLLDGTEDVTLISGTTETDVHLTDRIALAPTDRLRITTTGASAALQAQVVYSVGS